MKFNVNQCNSERLALVLVNFISRDIAQLKVESDDGQGGDGDQRLSHRRELSRN